jgi:lysozyme
VSDYGIDVSGYNAIANWSSVLGVGNSWAWCKATESSGYVSNRFANAVTGESQFRDAGRAGLRPGAYHFADPRVSAQANADHFLAVAGAAGALSAGAFAPMLDMENEAGAFTWTAAQANAFIPAWMARVRAATGDIPIVVYASQSWWSTGFLRPGDWMTAQTYLCAARYGVAAGNVGWSHPRLAFHQYTDAASPFGTDRSILLGGFSLDQLTIGKGDEDMAYGGFWFIGKKDDQGNLTGEVALLYPNGWFVGVDNSNWSAVVGANQVPKLDVPPIVWDDMAKRSGVEAGTLAAALVAAGVGGTTITVTMPDGSRLAGKLVVDPNDALHFSWVPDTAPATPAGQ